MPRVANFWQKLPGRRAFLTQKLKQTNCHIADTCTHLPSPSIHSKQGLHSHSSSRRLHHQPAPPTHHSLSLSHTFASAPSDAVSTDDARTNECIDEDRGDGGGADVLLDSRLIASRIDSRPRSPRSWRRARARSFLLPARVEPVLCGLLVLTRLEGKDGLFTKLVRSVRTLFCFSSVTSRRFRMCCARRSSVSSDGSGSPSERSK